MTQNFNGLEIIVHETNDSKQWYMTVEEVAKGYGVADVTIRRHLQEHSDELREGVEKAVVQNMNTSSNGVTQRREMTVIYREGVIKLGFFIRSKQASVFRQWATNLVIAVLDQTNTSMTQFFDGLNQRMDNIENVCRGMRTEIDELKEMVQIAFTDKEAEEIRSLINRVKVETKLDGRTIVGHIRKTLQTSYIYGGPETKKIINTLRNMLGEGVLGAVK